MKPRNPHFQLFMGTARLDPSRLLSLTYEDHLKRADKATFKLENSDLGLYDKPGLSAGKELRLVWGSGTDSTARQVRIRSMRGFSTLTVEAVAKSMQLSHIEKARSWFDVSISDVVAEIAGEYGFAGVQPKIDAPTEVLPSIHQVAESDAAFLARLARRFDLVFRVDREGLYFGPRQDGDAPTRVFHWRHGRGNVLAVTVETNLARRVGHLRMVGRNPYRKRTVTVDVDADTVDRTTLGETREVVNPVTGESVEVPGTSAMRSSPQPDEEGIRADAEAHFKTSEAPTVKLRLRVVGDPTLRAGEVVTVQGISARLSGNYFVVAVKHDLTPNGYVCELSLQRDGHSRRSSVDRTRSKVAQETARPHREWGRHGEKW